MPDRLRLNLVNTQEMRYGENPHQVAALYATDEQLGPLGGALLQGKALSYNNMLDLDAAWQAVQSFSEPSVVIVKHNTDRKKALIFFNFIFDLLGYQIYSSPTFAAL